MQTAPLETHKNAVLATGMMLGQNLLNSAPMDGGIGGVAKLLGDEGVAHLFGQLLGAKVGGIRGAHNPPSVVFSYQNGGISLP